MHQLPKRTSLVAETADALKRWISDGELREALPGELPLKARLGVGRDTLRLALKLMEEEGWIHSPGQGKQRFVQKDRIPALRPVANRHLPVTFLSPFPTVDQIMLVEFNELQKHLAEQGRQLRFVSSSRVHSERPEPHLKQIVSENPSAAWMLHFVNEATQRWFDKQGLPAFIYGSPFPGVSLPFVVNDWESAAYHAGVQLTRHGHRVIAQMAFEQMMPGMVAIERGLRRALASVTPAAQLLVFRDESSPGSTAHSLEAAFKLEPRPSALVLCASSQLLTCYSWMTSKGIAVPRDVSMVCIPSDSWFRELNPPVCHYENNTKIFARYVRLKVMELVETGRVTRRAAHVNLEYRPGATIGPAPRVSLEAAPPPRPHVVLS